MTHGGMTETTGLVLEIILASGFFILIGLYFWAGIVSSRCNRLRKWPLYRYIFWLVGNMCAAAAVTGPLAHLAQADFTIHMLGHLLLGMLAPILLVLSAPMTLLLRTLTVNWAKRVTGFLNSLPVRFVGHPIIASVLNMGGLWVLYATDLYMLMHHSLVINILIHLHVFLAGYVFTAAMIYIDPISHRYSFRYRSIVLILAIASHAILSKYIYSNPPATVPVSDAEAGAMLMYYGGDMVDLILIFILCLQWYKAARPEIVSDRKPIIN